LVFLIFDWGWRVVNQCALHKHKLQKGSAVINFSTKVYRTWNNLFDWCFYLVWSFCGFQNLFWVSCHVPTKMCYFGFSLIGDLLHKHKLQKGSAVKLPKTPSIFRPKFIVLDTTLLIDVFIWSEISVAFRTCSECLPT
jgi:hypothetical protein